MSEKVYRLTARAQMHGEVREPGYMFTLAEGETGPMRTINGSQHGAQIADHIGAGVEMTEEPLYEEVRDEQPRPIAESSPPPEDLATQLASAQARIAELEAQVAAQAGAGTDGGAAPADNTVKPKGAKTPLPGSPFDGKDESRG